MAARRRYTAQEAASILAFTDEESDDSDLETSEESSEESYESESDILDIVVAKPLKENVSQASSSTNFSSSTTNAEHK